MKKCVLLFTFDVITKNLLNVVIIYILIKNLFVKEAHLSIIISCGIFGREERTILFLFNNLFMPKRPNRRLKHEKMEAHKRSNRPTSIFLS